MLVINNKKLVYFGFALIVFKYTMASSAILLPLFVNNILMFLGIALFLPNILKNTYTKFEFLFFGLAVLYGLYIIKLSGDDLILLIAFFAIAIKNVDYKQLANIYLIVSLLTFVSIIVISLITRTNLTMTAAYRGEGMYISRYTLGFSHPNALQGVYLRVVCALVLSDLLIKHRKMKYLGLECINCIFFLLSNSRTGFLVITLILLLSFFKDLFIRIFKRKVFYNLIVGLSLGTIVFTIFATYNYLKYPVLNIINEMITGRFQHANRFVSRFPVQLLGTDISSLTKYYTLDSGIISTLLNYGVVGFSIVIVVYLIGLQKLWKDTEYIAMIVVLGFVIYSVMESVFINPFVNIGLLICLVKTINSKWVRKSGYR